jgi:hypothetical protein
MLLSITVVLKYSDRAHQLSPRLQLACQLFEGIDNISKWRLIVKSEGCPPE